MAKVYEFGCAPQAVEEGFAPSVTIEYGTLVEVMAKYDGQDVAIVYGAKVNGTNDQSEFAVLAKAFSHVRERISASGVTIPEGATKYHTGRSEQGDFGIFFYVPAGKGWEDFRFTKLSSQQIASLSLSPKVLTTLGCNLVPAC